MALRCLRLPAIAVLVALGVTRARRLRNSAWCDLVPLFKTTQEWRAEHP